MAATSRARRVGLPSTSSSRAKAASTREPTGVGILDRLGPGALGLRQQRGQLEQRERISAGGLEQPHRHVWRERATRATGEQLRRSGEIQAAHHELRESLRHALAAAGREQQDDPLPLQAAGDEPERLARRPVDPRGIVDDRQQRRPLGGGRQQAERRRRDREAIRGGRWPERQRALQRGGLRAGQRAELVEQRREQVGQAGERQL